MKTGIYVKTSNTIRLLDGIAALEVRGADEANHVVLDGHVGLGKTETIQWWATQNDAIYLRAKVTWNPGWVMRELLEQLGVRPQVGSERLFKQILAAVKAAQAKAAEGTVFAIIVDETDHLVERPKILETLRDISDVSGVPIIWVGMDKVFHGLAARLQIGRRIQGRHIEFQQLSNDDVTRMVSELSEVPVAEDMIAYLTKASEGYASEVMEGIAAIERVGKRKRGEDVTVKMMAGQLLFLDRRNGNPIKVKA